MDVGKGLHGVEWCSWECTVTNNDTKTHTHTPLSMCWKSIPRSIAHLIHISYAMYDFSSLNPYFNTVISAREYTFNVIYSVRKKCRNNYSNMFVDSL